METYDGARPDEAAGETQIIISLTSYPPRIEGVADTVRSLLAQHHKPDKVILWLAHEDFENFEDDLPQDLLDLADDPLFDICWSEITLGPHDKYFWSMRKWPAARILTVDDDKIYDRTLLSNMLDVSRRHPGAVVAGLTHRIRSSRNGHLLPYAEWELNQTSIIDQPRSDLMAVGAGGVLYPPRCFPSHAFNKEEIKTLALFADDLWLLMWEELMGIPVVAIEPCDLGTVDGSQEVALFRTNLLSGGNDEHIRSLTSRHPKFMAKLVSGSLSA